MARIHIESDDELPELDEILGAKSTRTKSTRSDGRKKSPTRPKPQTASAKDEILPTKSKQRSLKKIDPMQSLFGPFDASKAFEPTKVETRRKEVRSSPRKGKTVKQIKIFEDEDVKEVKPAIEVDDIHPSEENEEIEEIEETQGLEEVAPVVEDEGPSISSSEEDSYHVSEDSGSDDESWLGFKKDRESPFKRLLKSRPRSKIDLEDPKLQLSPTKVTEPANPFLGPRIAPPITSPPRPTSSSSALDNAAILHYTPPKRVSPSKKKQTSTPPREPEVPPSPSKRLNSPTKARFTNIPRAAVRESLDAFWSQDAVNDWNEQYSPRKMVGSPRKTRFATPNSDDEGAENGGPPSPSTSPRKSRSPAKNASPVKSKEAREMKKAWDVRKKKMAQEFLDELDKTIAEGKISEMAAATGGIQIIWNKKLKTTAGRANWKREKIRDLQPDKSTRTWFKHTANVELAEKVIDDEVKLINVVAHEFCHLCNFMISGVRDNPHGRQFKEWAKQVSRTFGARGIEVTTKHSYDIDYKYIWECTECGLEFKRHSKSIDPTKQACGACKGRLRQTQPPVRENAGQPTEYQKFVKEHCQRVKRENPGMKHGEVMEILGRLWREGKEKREGSGVAGKSALDAVVRKLEVVTLDD